MEQPDDNLHEFIPASNIEGGDDRPIFKDEQIMDEDLPKLTIDDVYVNVADPCPDDYYVDGNGQLKEWPHPNINNIL